MGTINQVEITPVFVELIPDVIEDLKFYISEKYHTAVHNCLCGCGDKIVTPLNHSGTTNWWDIVRNGDKISLLGSIGRSQFPCQSHYVITNNIANSV